LSKLETRVRPNLQRRAFDFLLHQSMSFHANTFSGSIVNQVNRLTSAYISLTDSLVINILRIFANIVIAIVVLCFFSWPVALVMLLWTVGFTYLNMRLTRKRAHLSRKAAAADTVLTGHLADVIGNIGAVKAAAAERSEAILHDKLSWDRAYKKYAAWMRATKNDAYFGGLMTFLQVTILIMSIVFIIWGWIDIGTLLLLQVYLSQIMAELWGLSGLSRSIEQALTDAGEMTEILEQKPGVVDVPHPEKATIEQGAIRLDHVTFAHDDADDALFIDFNLTIKAGERIGLVGHSGSGKTTLTRLLLRFSDVDSGTITIDGQNIARITQADLRRSIAYVPQEPLLFHRSIKENIGYGMSATTETLHLAAQRAHADEFIQTLPHGYDTLVGERGVKLSGGQRQRIAIARAMLKDAPILVLDEATSALDSQSEVLIQDALWQLMKGRTAIVIAHRLSTIQKMDRIVVLDNGRIVEEGTHKALLRADGTYAALWAHQSGGFIEE